MSLGADLAKGGPQKDVLCHSKHVNRNKPFYIID
jgi:hypothetical protein